MQEALRQSAASAEYKRIVAHILQAIKTRLKKDSVWCVVEGPEDRTVYNSIQSRFKLNLLEKYLAYAKHISLYRIAPYDNEHIRQQILHQWYDGYKHGIIDKYLLWSIDCIDRHLGILL